MKKYIIGNLKMNLNTVTERERYLDWMEKGMKGKKFNDAEIILCPPYVYLESFSQRKNKKIHPVKSSLREVSARGGQFNRVKIGAQNLFQEPKGSFTGEVSAGMLKAVGCEYVIIGHSERRKYFGETSSLANQKIKSALKAGIKPIYCFGETRAERDGGFIKDVITNQILAAVEGISPMNLEKIIFAYEPVWAVGTDVIPKVNEILEVRILWKKILMEKFSAKTIGRTSLLYGGSVKAKWAKEVCLDPEMDGVLIGRESLVPDEFLKIAEIISK
jgi:triosephosphate isomerase